MKSSFKKKLNNFSQNDNLKVLLSILVLFVGLIVNNFSVKEIMDWKYFSSIVLAALFLFIVNTIQNKFLNYTEDVVKITDDYNSLIKKYNNVDFVKTNEKGNTIVISKVLDFNCDNEVIIEDDNSFENRYKLPQIIKTNFVKILKSHSTSKINNSKSVRLYGYKIKNNKIILKIHSTTYYDFIVTNLACDYEFEKNITIRELYEPGPYLSSFEKSRVANRLGFDFFYKTKDDYILFVYRDNKKVMAKNTFSFSFSSNVFSSDEKINYDILNNQIKDLVSNDIYCVKTKKNKKTLNDFINIKWKFLYRDIHHCGVPKIFVEVNIKLNLEEILINCMFSDKLRKNNNAIWIRKDAFEKKSFTNDILTLYGDTLKNNMIPAMANIDYDRFVILHFCGFSNKNLKTTPAISGALYLYLNEIC